jgi:hypothetical protein
MTLAIGHRGADWNRRLLDLARQWRGPFNPDGVVDEIVGELCRYRSSSVTGDFYGGEWVGERFRAHGIDYRRADNRRSISSFWGRSTAVRASSSTIGA